MKTQQWLLNIKPKSMPVISGPPDKQTFKHVTVDLPELKEGQVLIKTLFFSNDPAQRGWISGAIDPERLYVPPVEVGTPMRSRAVGEIIESQSKKLKKGDMVTATTGWVEYAVQDDSAVMPIEHIEGLSDTHYLGSFGLTGVTAYYGLVNIADAKPTDVVVVSGAAGATGSMVVQIAKHLLSCKKVIGFAGTDEKCQWVKSLGADECLNYKKDSFVEDVRKATDGFANVFFDNVGGDQLDMMLTRMAKHGRIAACGAISQYNREDDLGGLKNWFQIVSNRIKIQGFIVMDAGSQMPQIVEVLKQGVKDGKLKVGEANETVVPTSFQDVPKTWTSLFSGSNTGKLVTKLV